MKPNEVIKEIMKQRGFSNKSLADALSKSTASAVSNALSRKKGMRVDVFIEMLDAMNCELVVKSKLSDKGKWDVTNEDED